MTWWAYTIIVIFVVIAAIVEWLERREIRRMKLWRDAERAARLRLEQQDKALDNIKVRRKKCRHLGGVN